MRHGETVWNREIRYQGSSDVPLSEVGEAQAMQLAARMSRIEVDRVFTSPLTRARRTAELVAGRSVSRPVVTDMPELREYAFGVWEGRTVDEIRATDGEKLSRWWRAPFTVMPEGAEEPALCFSRARRAADVLAEGGTSFLVAHGVIIRVLLGALLSIGDLSILWRMRIDNCSVTLVEMWNGRPWLSALNDTTHARVSAEEAERLGFHEQLVVK